MPLNLPLGITGYRSLKEEELPITDGTEFIQHCYAIIRQLGGKVKSTTEENFYRNFYTVKYDYHGEINFVLLNKHYPFLAFASSIDSLTFLDFPDMAATFNVFYTVLSKEILNRALTADHLSTLSKAELEQITYWKPETIGEVIFNNWD